MKKILKSVAVIFVIGVGAILFVLSHQVAGLRAFIVSSGSMEPTIATGSLVVTKSTKPATLALHDVITFIPPTGNRNFITHRIASISTQNNLTTIKTKGDNNKQIDNWVLAGGGVVGKVVLSVPYVGYVFSFTQSKVGLVLLTLVPALYIVYTELEFLHAYFVKKKQLASVISAGTVTAMVFSITPAIGIVSTQALLSDTTSLIHNTFYVRQITAPSQNESCTITVSNNASGSTNNVTCNIQSLETISQTNTTSVTHSTIIQNNSGENQITN